MVKVAEVVLEYVKALAWPAVVLVAIIVFRKRLQELLGRLKSFKAPGGLEALFHEGLAEVKDRLEEAQTAVDHAGPPVEPALPVESRKSEPPTGPQPALSATEVTEAWALVGEQEREALNELARIRTDAERDPNKAVLDAWRTLDRCLSNLAWIMKLVQPELARGATITRVPFLTGQPQLREAILGLRRLRHQVVGGNENALEGRTAQQYVDAAEHVISSAASLTRRRLVALGGGTRGPEPSESPLVEVAVP